jgi:hypothetical protein
MSLHSVITQKTVLFIDTVVNGKVIPVQAVVALRVVRG